MDTKKVRKYDIVDTIYSETNIDKRIVQISIDYFLTLLKDSLKKGYTIELRGFGTFEPRLRKGKSKARNPKSGETVVVDPHYVAAFRPGLDLKKSLWKIPVNEEK